MHGAITADRQLVPLGFQQTAAVDSTVSGLPSKPKNADYAFVQANGGDVRWRDDGTAPTSTVGHKLLEDETFWYNGDIQKIQFIRDSGSSGTTTVNVSYYRPK